MFMIASEHKQHTGDAMSQTCTGLATVQMWCTASTDMVDMCR